jgi:hypothetical protein
MPEPLASAAEVSLLTRAIADPFVVAGTDPETPPIEAWFRLARKMAPLWCFDRQAFMALRGDELPSTFPLAALVGSVAVDDGAFYAFQDSEDLAPTPFDDTHLFQNLTARRFLLPDAERLGDTLVPTTPSNGRSSVQGMHPAASFELAHIHRRVLPSDLEDDVDPSPYHAVGERVVQLVEALEWAATKTARRQARARLDEYLSTIGITKRRGHPSHGTSNRILRELFTQGQWLIRVCWEVLPSTASSRTISLLRGLDGDQYDPHFGATRLAVPMLSATELEALQRDAAQPLGRQKRHTRARRFTLHCLARRLRVSQVSIAERLKPPSDVAYMKVTPSPIMDPPWRASRSPR